MEHELATSMLQAKQGSQKPVDSPPPKGAKEDVQQQKQHSAVIDTHYVESFLKRDMCLRGVSLSYCLASGSESKSQITGLLG